MLLAARWKLSDLPHPISSPKIDIMNVKNEVKMQTLYVKVNTLLSL